MHIIGIRYLFPNFVMFLLSEGISPHISPDHLPPGISSPRSSPRASAPLPNIPILWQFPEYMNIIVYRFYVKGLGLYYQAFFFCENDRSGYVEVTQNLFHANDRRSCGEFEPIRFFLPKFPVFIYGVDVDVHQIQKHKGL